MYQSINEPNGVTHPDPPFASSKNFFIYRESWVVVPPPPVVKQLKYIFSILKSYFYIVST